MCKKYALVLLSVFLGVVVLIVGNHSLLKSSSSCRETISNDPVYLQVLEVSNGSILCRLNENRTCRVAMYGTSTPRINSTMKIFRSDSGLCRMDSETTHGCYNGIIAFNTVFGSCGFAAIFVVLKASQYLLHDFCAK